MKQEKISTIECRYPLLSVELGRGLYGLYDRTVEEQIGIAINVDKYQVKNGFIGLTKHDALELYQALRDMIEVMG